jgi:hypothetical protein
MMSHCVVLCLRGEAGLRLLVRVGAHRIAGLAAVYAARMSIHHIQGGGGVPRRMGRPSSPLGDADISATSWCHMVLLLCHRPPVDLDDWLVRVGTHRIAGLQQHMQHTMPTPSYPVVGA